MQSINRLFLNHSLKTQLIGWFLLLSLLPLSLTALTSYLIVKSSLFNELNHFLDSQNLRQARFIDDEIKKTDQSIHAIKAKWRNFVVTSPILGSTGETLFITENQNQFVSIAPFRLEKSLEDPSSISPTTPFGQFIEAVFREKERKAIINDYRDQPVLMIGRFIPTLNWVLVTKMDIEEILLPAYRLRNLLLITTSLLTIGIVAIASRVARTITHPILVLTRKTRLMAAGDLSQRIHIRANDELERLGQSFNEMAIQLDSVVKNLDEIVGQRTQEVEWQNMQLEQTIQELQEAQDRLANQEKLASLGALTAGIAHEIKNPLNFINNFAELSLQIDQELQEHLEKIEGSIIPEERTQLHEYLDTLKLNITKIYEHGKRADTIVHNMLQHSRGTPGEKVLIDLNALLDEYVTLSYHGARAQDISFHVKIEKNYDRSLPKVYAVPQEMSRVFLNLLNNAYYSIHQKELEIHDPSYVPLVRISTKNYKDKVEIKIWDNGRGIANEIFPKLFTPFFTTKPPGEGTGLGLSLSYTIIVQGHHGTLMADSEPGQFAEFVIQLPISAKDKEQ